MKDDKTRKIVLIIILFIIVIISIFYAIVSTSIKINGTSSINKQNWNVYFANIQISDGSVKAEKIPTIQKSETELSYDVNFYTPGEFYEFTVDVVNSGTIDAVLSENPEIAGINKEKNNYINYSVTYSDGNAIKKNDLLLAGNRKTLKVRIEYKKDVNLAQVPKGITSLNPTYKMNYIQNKRKIGINW